MSQPLIVVGIDGFAESKHALLWAAEQAREFARTFTDEAFGPEPQVHVMTRTVRGRPAQVLVDASTHADLLVIGPHRRLARVRRERS